MADGTLQPNEALLPGLGVLQAKAFAVPFPAPVPPKTPCLTCAKEPVVTTPKTQPSPTPMPPTTPPPVPPTMPKTTAPTVPTSSVLDQELWKARQELLKQIVPPSVPATAPSIPPPPNTQPRPITTPVPVLAAPRELLWSQLGVGYVGMQPFTRPMINGGLSGMMTSFRPSEEGFGNLQFTPLWDPATTDDNLDFPGANGTKVTITVDDDKVTWEFPGGESVDTGKDQGAIVGRLIDPDKHVTITQIVPKDGVRLPGRPARLGELVVIVVKGCTRVTFIQYFRNFAFMCWCDTKLAPEPVPPQVPELGKPGTLAGINQGWTNDVQPPTNESRSEENLPGGDDKKEATGFNQANGSTGLGFGGKHPDSLVDFPSMESIGGTDATYTTVGVRKYVVIKEYLDIIYCDDTEILRVYHGHKYVRTFPCEGDDGNTMDKDGTVRDKEGRVLDAHDAVTPLAIETKKPNQVNQAYDDAVADANRSTRVLIDLGK